MIGGRAEFTVACFVTLVLVSGPLAQAGTVVSVGTKAVVVFERPDKRAARVGTARSQTELEVLGREDDWYWVVLPPDADGVKRSGWVPVDAITDPRAASIEKGRLATAPAAAVPPAQEPPSTSIVVVPSTSLAAVAAEARARATGPSDAEPVDAPAARRPPAAAVRPSATGRTSGRPAPPEPVGGAPRERQSSLGIWFVPQTLRATVTADYQSATSIQDPGRTDLSLFGGGVTIAGAFAVLDPRILSVDFSGDLRAARGSNAAGTSSYRRTANLRNYHLGLGILSGRSLPLHVYTDRLTSDNNVEPSANTLDSTQSFHWVRTGSGFSWEVNSARLPRILVNASTSTQTDERNYLFGDTSTNREERAEIRASRDYATGRYDLDITHDLFNYEVPSAGVRSASGNDSFVATGRLTPSSRLTLDGTGRATRFGFGVGSQRSSVAGGGAGGSVRYKLTSNVDASGRYSFSSNAFEAALSGQLGSGQPGATPVTAGARLTTRTVFQDGEGRVEYTTRRVTSAVFFRGTAFGVPPGQAVTLGSLFTAGGSVAIERSVHGLTVIAGADGSAGPARSTWGQVEPYRETGVSLGATRNVGGYLTLGADGAVRRVGHISFYPVTLDSRSASLRTETLKPAWARLQIAGTYFDTRREISPSNGADRTFGYSASLRGPLYTVIAEFNQRSTLPYLLAPGVLGSRADLTGVVASRPDLISNLLAVDDLARAFTVQLRPLAGLQVQGRALGQERRYPGLFGYRIRSEQVWVTYHVRDLQLEFGWDDFDSISTFQNVRDRRIYFRIRRDVLFF